MAREQTVTKLSKSILEMKFMKKTKEKVEQELQDAEGREMYSHEITDEMRKSGAKCFIYEPSFAPLEDLIVGRLSFRGMNPEIERLMELENAEAQRLEDKRKETDVTDAEMAAFYNPLVKTLDKKFKRNRDQSGSAEGGSEAKRQRVDQRKYKFNKYEQNCDSPSVQHKDKRRKFMKPSDY